MKKILIAISLLFCPILASAQTTVVSATVVDNQGTAWAGGGWQAQLIGNASNPSGQYYLDGVLITPSQTQASGILDNTGTFSSTLLDNTHITPFGSQWKFTLCSNTSMACSTATTIVSGTTENLSSFFTANIVPPLVNAPTMPKAYLDSEVNVVPASLSALYYNVTSSTARLWTGTAWVAIGSGGGGGSPGNPNFSLQYNYGGAFTGSGNLTWNPTTNTLTIGGTSTTSFVKTQNLIPYGTPAFDVRAYGAVCDGVTLDDTAFANAEAAASGVGFSLGGDGFVTGPTGYTCALSRTFKVTSHMAMTGVTLTTAYNGPLVQLGSDTTYTPNKYWYLPNMINTAKPSVGWAGITNSVGVSIKSAVEAHVYWGHTQNFYTCSLFQDTATNNHGVAYSEYHLNWEDNCFYGEHIYTTNTTGYVNEDHWYGGRISQNGTEYPHTLITGTQVKGSNIITGISPSTSGLTVGMPIAASNIITPSVSIPPDSEVGSIDSSTQIHIVQNETATIASGSNVVNNLYNTFYMHAPTPGSTITGAAVSGGSTYVVSVNTGASTIVMLVAAQASATSQACTFSYGGVPTATTCTYTNGSTTVSVASTASIVGFTGTGDSVTGLGIPGGTTILAITSANQLYLSNNATASYSNATLTFPANALFNSVDLVGYTYSDYSFPIKGSRAILVDYYPNVYVSGSNNLQFKDISVEGDGWEYMVECIACINNGFENLRYEGSAPRFKFTDYGNIAPIASSEKNYISKGFYSDFLQVIDGPYSESNRLDTVTTDVFPTASSIGNLVLSNSVGGTTPVISIFPFPQNGNFFSQNFQPSTISMLLVAPAYLPSGTGVLAVNNSTSVQLNEQAKASGTASCIFTTTAGVTVLTTTCTFVNGSAAVTTTSVTGVTIPTNNGWTNILSANSFQSKAPTDAYPRVFLNHYSGAFCFGDGTVNITLGGYPCVGSGPAGKDFYIENGYTHFTPLNASLSNYNQAGFVIGSDWFWTDVNGYLRESIGSAPTSDTGGALVAPPPIVYVANAQVANPKFYVGTGTLNGGTGTSSAQLSFSPGFTSATSYVCTITGNVAWDNTVYTSVNTASTFSTVEGPSGSTDSFNYSCIGN